MTTSDPRLDEAFASKSVRVGPVGAESKEHGGDEQEQRDGEREDGEVVAAAGNEGDKENDVGPDAAAEENEGSKSDAASGSRTSRPQSVRSDDAPVMKGVSYPGDEWIPRWEVD